MKIIYRHTIHMKGNANTVDRKKCSISLVIREFEMETIMKYL